MEKVGKLIGASLTAPKTRGRLLALDLGAKRIGVAVSDELQITAKPLAMIKRRSWKELVHKIESLVESLNAKALVVGLPVRLNGSAGSAAESVRAEAEKFHRTLNVPVYLQDERLTTLDANADLKAAGRQGIDIKREVDSAAAAIILRDFIDRTNH